MPLFYIQRKNMAMDNTAAKVAKLREMAKDKSLPQDVRNTYLDEAVKLEEKAAMKAGVRMAVGGMPGAKPMPPKPSIPNRPGPKPLPTKPMPGSKPVISDVYPTLPKPMPKIMGGSADKMGPRSASAMMAKGGAVVAKAPKKMMYGGDMAKTMMAKGGDAKKKMMMGGAVAKELPKRGSRTATNMAKGGSVAKKAKK
jgi:hypothetical protein